MIQDPKRAEAEAWADAVMREMQGAAPMDPKRMGEESAALVTADNEQWADAALAELQGSYSKDPNGWENAARGAASGILGGVKNVVSDFPVAVGRGVAGLVASATGRELGPYEPSTFDVAGQIGKGLSAAQEAVKPDDLRSLDSAAFRYSEMGGYVLPMMASTLLGPEAAATIGATQQGGASGIMANQAGAGGAGTLGATAGGFLLGGAAGGSLEALMGRLNTTAGNALVKAMMRDAQSLSSTGRAMVEAGANTAVRTGEGVLAGAASGYTYTALTNAIHNWATDEDIPLLMGAEENAAFGAALGGIIRGATEAALTKRRLTGRKYTGNGVWDGAMLPEDVAVQEGAGGDFVAAMTEASDAARERGQTPAERATTAETSARLAEEAGARLRAEQANQPSRVNDYTTQGSPTDRAPIDPTRSVSEPNTTGLVQPRDESIAYAPLRPAYVPTAAEQNPVYNKQLGATIVTDVGTATNPGTGLRVTLENAINARTATLRTDVIRRVESAAQQLSNFVIRKGMVSEGASGLYDPKTKEARIARYGDIVAAAHEAGHSIETAAFGGEHSPDRLPAWNGIQKELAALGRALYGEVEPHNGYASEGFAEFSRLWLLQHEDVGRLAPETARWFEETFLPAHDEFKNAMLQAQETGDGYRFQGSALRTQTVDPNSWSMRFRTTTLGKLWSGFVTKWIETARPVYEMEKEAEAVLGKKPGRSATRLLTALRGTADGLLHNFIYDETYNRGGVRTGDALEQAIASVKGHGKDFDDYLALRAEKWRNEEKLRTDPATGEEVVGGMPIRTMAADLDFRLGQLEAKYPQFRGSADAVLAWYDRVMDHVGEWDPVLKESLDRIRQDGEFYVPLKKWADWYVEKTRGSGGKATETGQARVAQRAKGSAHEIVSPLASLIQQARNTIAIAHRRAVTNRVIDTAIEAGLPGWVTDVTDRVRSMVAGDLPLQPNERYMPGLNDWVNSKILESGVIEHPDGPIVPYKRAAIGEDGIPYVETRYYQMEPRLHQAILGTDPNTTMQALGAVGATMRFFKNTFVMGATGLNASFGMLKNPIRDAQSLYVNSRANPHLTTLIPQLMYEHARVFAHEISNGHIPYEWVDTYDRVGLASTDKFATFKTANAHKRELLRGGVSRYINLNGPMDTIHALAHVMQASEKATRIWEMKQTAKRVNWKPGDYMTPEQAVAMAVDARQVTVDFTAGGSIAKQINQVIPFLNVAIQGPRATVRAAIDRPGQFALRNAALMGIGAALWYRYKDEPWMKALPARDRFQYWYVPFTDPNGTTALGRIPLSQEAMIPVKTFEFFLESLHSQDPITVQEFMRTLIDQYSVDVLGPIAGEILAQSTNKNEVSLNPMNWNGPPLVPESLQREPYDKQYTPYTGEVSVAIGRVLHVSPIRIEHALRGLFAGVGTAASNGFGFMRGDRYAESSDLPIVGALVRKGGAMSLNSRHVEQLYDVSEQVERTWKDTGSESAHRKHLLLKDATQCVSYTRWLTDHGKLSAKQREQLVSEIDRIAVRALEAVRDGRSVDGDELEERKGLLKERVDAVKERTPPR